MDTFILGEELGEKPIINLILYLILICKVLLLSNIYPNVLLIPKL